MHRLNAFTHTTIKTLQNLIITTMYRILYIHEPVVHSNTLYSYIFLTIKRKLKLFKLIEDKNAPIKRTSLRQFYPCSLPFHMFMLHLFLRRISLLSHRHRVFTHTAVILRAAPANATTKYFDISIFVLKSGLSYFCNDLMSR